MPTLRTRAKPRRLAPRRDQADRTTRAAARGACARARRPAPPAPGAADGSPEDPTQRRACASERCVRRSRRERPVPVRCRQLSCAFIGAWLGRRDVPPRLFMACACAVLRSAHPVAVLVKQRGIRRLGRSSTAARTEKESESGSPRASGAASVRFSPAPAAMQVHELVQHAKHEIAA
jgi:hypothetical protein